MYCSVYVWSFHAALACFNNLLRLRTIVRNQDEEHGQKNIVLWSCSSSWLYDQILTVILNLFSQVYFSGSIKDMGQS